MAKPSLLTILLTLFLGLAPSAGQEGQPAIHFRWQPVPFSLDSDESPERHAPETMAGGVGVFDYDNDGNLDIFFTNGADLSSLKKTSAKYWNRLLRNDGKGNFSDVTEKAGLAGTGYDTGVAVGDFDNDGYADLFVGGVYRNTLYHNQGDGTFKDVTETAGLNRLDKQLGPLWSVGAAWVDLNNDGRLDLFVVNYLRWDAKQEPKCIFAGQPEYCAPRFYQPLPNQLFLNQGGGKFADVSLPSGVGKHPGKGMGVGVADYDGDGLPDIFVANDKLFNSLFHNLGNLRFEEIGSEAGVALPENANLISGMGVDFEDLNNDGLPDIVIVALANETFPVYQNTGKAGFLDTTAASGMAALSKPMAGYSPNIADFDNDGWKDIFVSRGDVASPAMSGRQTVEQPNSIFRNSPQGRWTALTEGAGFMAQPPRRHRGSAIGDFNHDGKIDVVVTALGAPAELWMNDSPDKNHWLELSLQGSKSNRQGIGARIELRAGGNIQFHHRSTAAGYASSSAGPVHFGLGAARLADEIRIRWPSGAVQILRAVTSDQILKVQEPN